MTEIKITATTEATTVTTNNLASGNRRGDTEDKWDPPLIHFPVTAVVESANVVI